MDAHSLHTEKRNHNSILMPFQKRSAVSFSTEFLISSSCLACIKSWTGFQAPAACSAPGIRSVPGLGCLHAFQCSRDSQLIRGESHHELTPDTTELGVESNYNSGL